MSKIKCEHCDNRNGKHIMKMKCLYCDMTYCIKCLLPDIHNCIHMSK